MRVRRWRWCGFNASSAIITVAIATLKSMIPVIIGSSRFALG